MMIVFQRFWDSQLRLSEKLDALLPLEYQIDGEYDFQKNFIPVFLKKHMKVYEIAGGKRPYFDLSLKKRFKARVIGMDVDVKELERAPEGIYDRKIIADVTEYRGGEGEADLVICRSGLVHVKDTEKALKNITRLLRPGGIALVYVPSRNALCIRFALLLPQMLKQKIRDLCFSPLARYMVPPGYYDRCTPRDFRQLARKSCLEILEEKFYFRSLYFAVFFPAHLAWRLWLFCFRLICGDQAAETFAMALRKLPEQQPQ